MMNIDNIAMNHMTKKAIAFYTQSDSAAWDELFGRCNTIEEINEMAEDLYDEFFGDED